MVRISVNVDPIFKKKVKKYSQLDHRSLNSFITKASSVYMGILNKNGGIKMAEKNKQIDIPLTAENCSVSIEEKEAVIKCKIPNGKSEEAEEEVA